MAKLSIEQAGQFSGSNNYFKIENDGETKDVRFLYKTVDDIDSYSVHEVKVGEKRRWVDCLKDPSDPESHCPFCDAGIKLQNRTFLLVWDEADQQAKVWERSSIQVSRNYMDILKNTSSEEIVGSKFKIKRNGKKGDMKTTYVLMLVGVDDTKMEDLQEELPETDATIMKKTVEEMEYYIENGEFPEEEVADKKTEHKGFKKSGAREVDAAPAEKPALKRRNRF